MAKIKLKITFFKKSDRPGIKAVAQEGTQYELEAEKTFYTEVVKLVKLYNDRMKKVNKDEYAIPDDYMLKSVSVSTDQKKGVGSLYFSDASVKSMSVEALVQRFDAMAKDANAGVVTKYDVYFRPAK